MNAENPLISIIMPIYNVEKYIAKSINSVIGQTYKNVELILVDDGSVDNSVKIAEDVLKDAKHEYKLIRQENMGQGAARNTGMRASCGEWLFFIDSDDMISSNMVEHLVSAIKQDVDIVFSDFRDVYDNCDFTQSVPKGEVVYISAEQLQRSFLLRDHIILAPGTLYRKSLIINHNIFYEHIPWSEDQHFVWRILRYINSAAYVKEPLYHYLRHSGSIMSATKTEKMKDSYPQICGLSAFYAKSDEIALFIVPRWVFGTCNSAACIVDYREWLSLFKSLDGKKHFRTLLKFPRKSVSLSAFICLISPRVYYYATRLRKRK